MSSTLMWKPLTGAQGSLSYELKRVISKRLWDTDGSCGGGVATMNSTDLDYLQGLMDAGIEGADEIIDLIHEHGDIQLWHEC